MSINPDPHLLYSHLYSSATKNPLDVAFIHGDKKLSYGDLRKAGLAGYQWLFSIGILPQDRVAVALPKNLITIRAFFSILSAGAIIVPIDPNAPPNRILSILSDSKPSLLITNRKLLGKLDASNFDHSIKSICLDSLEDWENAVDSSDEQDFVNLPEINSDALAVFFYTSGTTGSPKAICLTHRNISSFANWAIDKFNFTSSDVFASQAPLHFDLTTLDLYAATRVGASIILLDDITVKFPAKVSQLLETHGVTVWYSVPSALNYLVEFGALNMRNLESLRLIFFAGEPYSISALKKLIEAIPNAQYVNLYGPTETNVCTYYIVPKQIPHSMVSLPIGKPCEHLTVYIIGEQGQILSAGQEGEITVIGQAVMKGYWERDDLTSQSKLPNVIQSYKTGDFGFCDKEGLLYFSGRKDDLIKYRGYRIELLEIEAILAKHPKVLETAAFIRKNAEAPEQLIAAVAPKEGINLTQDEILEHCRKWLPTYSIPEEVYLLQEIPKTSTGKTDKFALKSDKYRGLA